MITLADIDKLAELSRIKLSGEEKESLRKEFDAILGYVDQIKKVHVGNVGGEQEAGMLRNVMREDDDAHASGEYTEAILREAPAREGNYLKVKKIL